MSIVYLTPYEPRFYEQLTTFTLPKEQAQFTSHPTGHLIASEGKFPVVIVAKHRAVGFFVVHKSEQVNVYSENKSAMLLTSYSINYSEQGKGFAKASLVLLPTFIQEQFPQCNEIVLAVNFRNEVAQQLYRDCGFVDTGKRIGGKIGQQLVMRLQIF